MAPTICCRGDVPSEFHRRREKRRQGGGRSSPQRRPGEGEAAPGAEEDGVPASLRGVVLMPASSTSPAAGAQRRQDKSTAGPLTRKVASARRRRRRPAATWFRRKTVDDDVTSGGDTTISTTTKHEGRGDVADWSAECGRRQGCGDVKGGLLGITVRTVELMRRNQLLQWRLSLLQEETRVFVESVLSNPENRGSTGGGESPSSVGQDPAISGSC